MFNTNFCFKPGKLTTVLDGGAGSSGKGKLGSFITAHADNWQFACNTFMANAGHWVKIDSGEQYFYQTLNSCAYQDRYEKIYVGPGSIIELPALLREIEENSMDLKKIGIHPIAGILQDIDSAFERGEADFDGNPIKSDGTMKYGSTCHGVGAARARRILRRSNVKLARDVPELKNMICNTSAEIMDRLDRGESGLLEIAQGFQLSYALDRFYPYCTSRNCTVAAGMDDLMVPVKYAGPVIINIRTYPIRISNNKYIDRQTGKHLSWEDIVKLGGEKSDKIEVYHGDSGPGYEDQQETTWEEVTSSSGSPKPIIEMTSVTKLPRRVFNFSIENLRDSIRYNQTMSPTYISINFANYVDHKISGLRGRWNDLTPQCKKFQKWLDPNILNIIKQYSVKPLASLKFIGTGELTDDMICV